MAIMCYAILCIFISMFIILYECVKNVFMDSFTHGIHL